MNKILRIALGLIALGFLLPGSILRAEETGNLLRNPGFEEIIPWTPRKALQGIIEATEMPRGWSIGGAPYPGKLTVIYDVETSHGGSRYIKLENKPAPGRKTYVLFAGTGHNRPIRVTPGKKYLIKVWVKGEGRIGIVAYGFTGRRFIQAFSSGLMKVKSPDDWKEYKFEFDTKKNEKDVNGLQAAFSIDGTLYLDDAYLGLMPTE